MGKSKKYSDDPEIIADQKSEAFSTSYGFIMTSDTSDASKNCLDFSTTNWDPDLAAATSYSEVAQSWTTEGAITFTAILSQTAQTNSLTTITDISGLTETINSLYWCM